MYLSHFSSRGLIFFYLDSNKYYLFNDTLNTFIINSYIGIGNIFW